MHDPFPSAPSFIQLLAEPLARRFNLLTLPFHVHEVLFAFGLYTVLNSHVSHQLSLWICPNIYNKLPAKTRINWNIHIVSLFQSILICYLALWIILKDEDRSLMDAKGRILGYSGATGLAQAFAAGYFLWDIFVSVQYFNILGPGSLAHAISAFVITSLGFRPFANYYGIAFVLYELSTPFLNFHWFFDKCGMTGTRYQLYNGIALLITFFGCRLCWGIYMSVKIYQDIYTLHSTGLRKNSIRDAITPPTLKETQIYEADRLPMWLIIVYLGSNTLLTFLNVYWFGQMLKAVRKRFPKEDANKETNGVKTE